jgi:menaquinone-dependent protoporphyrinogen oxidase
MKTAIIFASKHGTTAKVAHMIKNGLLYEQTDLINLKLYSKIDLSNYDSVIIGGSIHAGKIQNSVSNFCKSNTVALMGKKLGLFLCCMDNELGQNQFNTAFPELLRLHALSKKVVGGEFLFEKMNFIERIIVKKIAKVNSSVSKIDEQKIKELSEEMRK